GQGGSLATTNAAKKNVSSMPDTPPAATKSSSESKSQAATNLPAPGGIGTIPTLENVAAPEPQNANGIAAVEESVLKRFQQAVENARQDVVGEAPRPPRASRREQQAAVAEQPFVKRAMELFDVTPGQLRYSPPDEHIS